MFYAFLCILCILIQGTMVEQLCLNGFTLYKYICNKKNKKNGRHFADDIFNSIFLNENVWIPI